MTTVLLAGLLTFIFTALLTIAGVGAAFILIPVFIALHIDIHVAMAVALLLNSIAMSFASYSYIKSKLVLWKVAIPILIVATALSPVGAYVSQGLNAQILKWLFVGFLIFAGLMMLFYEPRERDVESSMSKQLIYGISIGAVAGFLGGLLGVGGGNIIIPVLVWMGINPKKASATTAFIVIFSSLSGFLGHATLGSIDIKLLGITAIASALGAVLGAWLMTEKLKRKQVKLIIGIVLIGIAAKMMWGLIIK
jgi:uncharacterized membrane protein YfcA